MNKPFNHEFQYAIRNIEFHAKPGEKAKLEVVDSLLIESVTDKELVFSIKRIVSSPTDTLTFFVEFMGILRFSESNTKVDTKDFEYWEEVLRGSESGYLVTLLSLMSTIISSVTLTFGERKPLISPPTFIANAEQKSKA